MLKKSKIFLFFAGFAVALTLGSSALFGIISAAHAAGVNVNATVSSVSGAVCGNDIQESGEECDGVDDGACNGNICESDCTCSTGGTGCTPGSCITSSCTDCVNGSQTCTGSNGCSSCSLVQSCTIPTCGNGTVEAPETCDDGNVVSGDGCDLTCQTEQCPQIGGPIGYYGRFYNHTPDGNEFQGINTGPIFGTTPFQYNWYDPAFVSFTETDSNLEFGADFYPIDEGLSGDPWHFAVHWSGLLIVAANGSYTFELASDDDTWVYIDNALAFDNGGTHAASFLSQSVNLSAGNHRIDVYFAERYTDKSFMSFRWLTSGVTTYPLPDGCPVAGVLCGNGVVEGSEQCDDGNTVNGDGCSSSCNTEIGPVSFCGDGVTDPGEQCDDGNNANGDGCSSSCQTETLPTGCGNGTVEGSEQCDDGNTVSGDGCSSSCTLENPNLCGNGQIDPGEQCDPPAPGCSATCQFETDLCGNGVLDPGEQCDPPGVGCSATCEIQLAIISHSVSDIGLDAATVEWTTNLPSTATLEWRESVGGQGQGSVDNLSGTTYSYTITNLTPGTRYDYTIVAVRAGVPFDQDSRAGTFVTLFRDTCGDGMCTGDETTQTCPQDCIPVCYPNWVPGPWSECVNGVQTRQYTDANNCPYSLDPPPNQRSCDGGSEVVCGACQQLDLATRGCVAIWPCCGDRVCEASESITSCPVDCGISPTITIPLPQCLDGRDNDHDGLVDYPADPGCSSPADDSELNLVEVFQRIADIFDNPVVEKVNETIAAPAIITAVAVSTFASFSLFNFLVYLRYIFTQPVAVLFRRRRKKWGVVFNSLSKQPVDLAIVRLYKKDNGQLIQSRVTDKQGRFNFLAPPGRYYLTVTKPKYNFPTLYLANKKEDAKYLDLYHGQTIDITDRQATIIVNIPIDPQEHAPTPIRVIIQHYLRKVQYALAFSAVPLAALSLAISPSLFTLSLLALHISLYIFFRRLGYQKRPKSWGVVYDRTDRKPVGLAITRIYDKQYNKLLESRVTDAKGRYAFLVDNNVYTVTSEKLGYKPSKIEEINLVDKDKEAIIDMNIAMEKGQGLVDIAPPASPNAPPAVQEPPSTGVDRQSLEKQITPKMPAQPANLEEKIDQLRSVQPAPQPPAPLSSSSTIPPVDEAQVQPQPPTPQPPTPPESSIFG